MLEKTWNVSLLFLALFVSDLKKVMRVNSEIPKLNCKTSIEKHKVPFLILISILIIFFVLKDSYSSFSYSFAISKIR